jgi:hypothetical protein
MRKMWSLLLAAILLFGVVQKVSAGTLVLPGPNLPAFESGWGNFGLLIQAKANVNLVSVRFPNQGKADLIELRRHSDGALLTSVATPTGNTNITVVFNYPLVAGTTYRILATTTSNRWWVSFSAWPVQNAHISVVSSFGGGNPQTGWWASFNDITTADITPIAKKANPPSILPLANTRISQATGLMIQANDLLTQAEAKNLDTASCEALIKEASDFLALAKKYSNSSTTANYFGVKAIEKFMQAIECLKALIG